MDVNTEEVVEPKNKKSTNIGELLIEARENRNWSAQEIADQMNLTLSVITQIEENRFNEDIPHAFLRGYIRSYAQRVGVDTESICAEFDIQVNANVEPVKNLKVVSQFKTRRKEINSNSFIFKLITSIIVIAILSFAGWELFKRVGEKTEAAPANSIELNQLERASDSGLTALNVDIQSDKSIAEQKTTTDQVQQDEAISSSDAKPQSEVAETTKFSADIQAAVSQAESKVTGADKITEANKVTGADRVTEADMSQIDLTDSVVSLVDMTFTFSADCWVKIVDGVGETIAIGVKTAGRVMPLQGVAPVTVILGDPAAVELTYAGEAYDMSVYQAGRRAEFVLN
ncbi:RodZ domain-containing protein [Aliikangiella sp. IMCC44653]